MPGRSLPRMSIVVDVTKLAETLRDFGSGYLLTVSPEGRVKVITVDPVVEGASLRVSGPSRGSATNLATNPTVTVVFPPREPRGYTLIVDGTAVPEGDDFAVAAQAAVLRRPAAHADGPPPPDGCGHDCVPVT